MSSAVLHVNSEQLHPKPESGFLSHRGSSQAVSFEADLGNVRAAWLRQFQAGQATVMPLAGALGLCQDALGLLTSRTDLSGNGNKHNCTI